jgi:hypothetical protein
MMAVPPPYIAAAPTPAMTRPTIKIEEEGERAQVRDPTSKQRNARIMRILMLK